MFMKTKKLFNVLLAAIAFFAVGEMKAVDYGSIMKTGELAYHQYNTGEPTELREAVTIDFKVVTIEEKSWAWTKINGGTIGGTDWESQLRYWPAGTPGNQGGAIENKFALRVPGAESTQSYGSTTNSIPSDLRISIFQNYGNGYSETVRIPYNVTIQNTPISGDLTAPILKSVIKETSINSVRIFFDAFDDNEIFYYLTIKDGNNIVATEVAFTNPYVYTTTENYTYEVEACDFNGNSSLTVKAIEGKVLPPFIPGNNIALNKNAYASINDGLARFFNDGQTNTGEWNTGAPLSEEQWEQWWYVDLGNVYMLDEVKISWEGAFAKSFKIQTAVTLPNDPESDLGWTDAYSVSGKPDNGEWTENYQLNEGTPIAGQYVRLKLIEPRNGAWGYRCFEFEVYSSGYYTPDFIIQAGETIPYTNYVGQGYGDIIFKANEHGEIGELTNIPPTGLYVNGVIKLQKTFTPKKWYPIGFPFAIEEIYCDAFKEEDDDGILSAFNASNNTGDFWLRTYKKNTDGENYDFVYSQSFEANKGYAIQFPSVFGTAGVGDKEITFTSELNPILTNTTEFADLTANKYEMRANPSLSNLELTDPYGTQHFYVFDGNVNFAHSESSTKTLKPFESLVLIEASGNPTLKSISMEGNETALGKINANSEKIVETHYYNLQGVEIPEPNANGLYIVKRIYDSKKVEIVKTLINKK